MKLKKLILPVVSALVLTQTVTFAEVETSNEYDYFERIMNYAAELYLDEDVNTDDLMTAAVSKLLEEHPELVEELLKNGFSSLDPYSEFYSADDYVNFMNNLNHVFYGIGVVIQKEGDYVKIVRVTEDGSAAGAGLEAGDKIVSVDGQDAVGKTVDEVQAMVVGELGTQVQMNILRGEQELSFTLTRQEVSSDTVGLTFLKGDIAYMPVINFAEKTDQEFAEKLAEVDAKGVTNIILDLRDNPGGYLISAVNIAKMIVPEGVIVQTIFRQEEKNETFYSDLKNPKYKFVVLVNQNTASAAEVLAGAMQDSGVGTLVGETTYGKAVIQDMYRLVDGRAFKITTGHYLTRNGNEINGKGIEPDEYVINYTQPIDISRYTTFDYKTKWSVGMSGEGVRAAKERLQILGYYTGEVNEQFDEALAEAVTKFQADTELYPYGVLDISTQVKLENTFYKLEEEVDVQLQRAYEIFGGDPNNIEVA